MPATRALSVKFGTEGFDQAVREMSRVAKSFDTALAKAQESVNQANLDLLRGMVMGSAKRQEQAEQARAKAARDANQIIRNSYRELRTTSEADLNSLRNQAISAYNAIRNSGVASARDIDRANLALKDRLTQIDQQLEQSTNRAKNFTQSYLDGVQAAKRAMAAADLTLTQSYASGNRNLQQSALQSRERSTWRLEQQTAGAFSLLGATPEATINRQRAQLIDAYNAIKASGIASARDIANAERQLNAQMLKLNQSLHGQETLWGKINAAGTGAIKNIAEGFAQAAGFTVVYGTINAIGNALRQALTFPFEAAKSYADFETQLKAIKVAADGADISPLKTEILELAPELGKLPQDLAALATEFTRAGFTAEQTAKLLRGVGLSSQATGEDISNVGEITRNTIKQFQVTEQDYAKVSDILVAGANKSAAGIGSLGEALSYVGPTAKLSNQSLEDTVTILAALSDVGITGSSAGTNWAEAMQRIKIASAGASDEVVITTRGMKTAVEAIDELGINFRNADGSLRPLLETLPELRAALEKLPKEDQEVIKRVLFGTQGERAINGLLAKTNDQLKELSKGISNSGGAASKAGEEMLSGFGGALQKLQASFEVGKLNLGEAIAPGLQAAAETADVLIGNMTEANGLFDEAAFASQEFANYLKQNPEQIEELSQQLESLIRTALKQANENAKLLLEYLEKNPKAIEDAVEQIGKMVTGLGQAAQLAQKVGTALAPVLSVTETLLNANIALLTLLNKPLDTNSWVNSVLALGELGKAGFLGPIGRAMGLGLDAGQGIGSGIGKIFGLGSTPAPGTKVFPVMNGPYVGGGGRFRAPRSYGPHTGEDIGGAPGTPVYAVMDGLVQSIKVMDAAVNSFSVTVKAADGTLQAYKHVTPWDLRLGQPIRAGEQIATISPKDKFSTGPHLHFDVNKGGQYIDPKEYLKGAVQVQGPPIPEKRGTAKGTSTTTTTTTNDKEPSTYGHKSYTEADRSNLVKVNELHGGNYLQPEAAAAVKQLIAAAARDGIEIGVADAHRSVAEQAQLFKAQVQRTGSESAAAKSVAPPGHSEHHTGYALDFGNASGLITGGVAADWLRVNAPKFGFQQSFTGKGGIMAEPWHYRFIGNETAKTALNLGQTETSKTALKAGLEAQLEAARAIKNQYQYLARIAAGESAGGKDIGPNPETGAYGEYQFTPETRQLLLKQAPNLDPWSKSKGTRDQAALKWIELYGKEVGTDLLGMIRRGDFEAVDKILGRPGPSGFAQFSSLPGGTEAAKIWQNPANLRKYAPVTADGKDLAGDTFFRQAEEERRRAQSLMESARKRADDRMRQQQDLERQALEDSQKRQLLNFDLATSQMPEGEAKAARADERQTLERRQRLAQEQLRIEQTLNQLIIERQQKLADIDAAQGAPEKLGQITGRDITAEINALKARKKALEENEAVEARIQKNNTNAELTKRAKDLEAQITEVNQTVAELKLQYADDTPERREAEAIATVNAEFAQHKKLVVDAIKATVDLIDAKSAQGIATEAELASLERLKAKYLEIQAIQDKQTGKALGANSLAEQQRLLNNDQATADLEGQIAAAKATRLERFGISDEANSLREQAAIAQEILRYRQQLLDLESTYKDQPEILDQLVQKASELNQLNLQNIKDQFKSVGETIQDSAQSALTTFFSDIFSGTKSVGDAFSAMAKSILNTLGQLAAQMLAQSIFKLLGKLLGGGGGGFFSNITGGNFGGADFSWGTGIGSLPTFHSGGYTGNGGEFLALLRGNEFVLNPTATNFFGPQNLARMNSLSPLPSNMGRGSMQSGPPIINVNVNTPDANSFNRSEMQIGQITAEQLYRAQRRNGV